MSENGEEDSNAVVGSTRFDLPEEVLQVLPSDPFEQLDVARKITSIALSTRVTALESESLDLREKLSERDGVIARLQSELESLEASLSDAFDKLSRADREKETLLSENASLSSTVRKLQRDVSKLEVFRKTLVQSLREDEENAGTTQIIAKLTPNDDDSPFPPSRHSSTRSQASEAVDSASNDNETDAPKHSLSTGIAIASQASLAIGSQSSTPRLTPPGSPPFLSAFSSPTRTSRPLSPKRHAMSFSTSRGMLDDRSHTGRARVDGKELFRQVRNRLSYEQFGAFLANVKDFNAHKQTREETLEKAVGIFGAENNDLFLIFQSLIKRNVH